MSTMQGPSKAGHDESQHTSGQRRTEVKACGRLMGERRTDVLKME